MRITKEMRTEIIAACVKAMFDKRRKAYDAARVKLADTIYAREFGSSEEIAATLPRQWQHTMGSLTIRHDGYARESVYNAPPPNTVGSTLKLSKLRLAPHSGVIEVKITKGDHLYKMADDVSRTGCKIKAEAEALTEKLGVLLAAITTSNQLLAAWPEGAKFFPDFTPVQRATGIVPVSLIKEVNAIVQANA